MLRFLKSEALQPTDFRTRDNEVVKLNPVFGRRAAQNCCGPPSLRGAPQIRLTKPSRPDESGLGTTAFR